MSPVEIEPDDVATPPPAAGPNALQKLLDFLERLAESNTPYKLACHRDAIMVELAVPGERWEIEFFANGEVEVERFRSNGHIAEEAELAELFNFIEE